MLCVLPLNFQTCWKILGQGMPMPCVLPLNFQTSRKFWGMGEANALCIAPIQLVIRKLSMGEANAL